MTLLVGIGLALPLTTHPAIYAALRWTSVAWLLFLAVQIARAAPPGDDEAGRRPPLGFLGGALFQWVNPKARLIAVGGTATYVAADAPVLPQVAIIATLFAVTAFPSLLFWAALGLRAGRFLHAQWRLRPFNFAMAALLVMSVLPVLGGE